MTIYFYGANEVRYGCFSKFSGHGFDLDGHWWTTSEHYFRAQKFPGTRDAELIRRTATPLRAAELGRDRSRPLRRAWERVKRARSPSSILLLLSDFAIICGHMSDRKHYRRNGRSQLRARFRHVGTAGRCDA
ncbi:NADAR family protein [Micromonospora sonneratiae]